MSARPSLPRGWRTGGIVAPLAALVCALLLLAAGIGLALYIDRVYEQRQVDDLSAEARILAATATAALAFNDPVAAREYLVALHADPDIVAAALYGPSGALFASYPNELPGTLPRTFSGSETITRADGLVTVIEPVRQDNSVLGRLLLQTPTEQFAARVQREGAIALLLAMAALLVGVLGAGQSALRRANVALRARAAELAAANENLEASNRSLEEQIARREQAEAALRQAQKMDAIGRLTGGVAHDFNNLLQVVQGSLERLRFRAARDGFTLPAQLDRMIETALEGARRAATLTRQLLAFSRRQPLAPKPLDVNKMVASMSELLGRTLGESIRIETVLAAGLWRVLVDENQLASAILNLAVNARDAMPPGGKLTIETANSFLDEIYVRTEQDVRAGQYVMLAVTDTGSGMAPEVLEKVFEPFFTTKGVGHGTGLGLSQVYGFIKQSGGHVKIYTEAGQGTTVKMYLPRLNGAMDDSGADADRERVPQGSASECVLVVEDEESVRALSVEMLRDLGYRVVEAADGPSALAALEREPAVRMLFTDVGLPGGMDGRQLAEAARRLRPALKVLFTTGYARNAIVHHGRLDHGVDLITKPFAAEDLGRRVRAVLDAREGQFS